MKMSAFPLPVAGFPNLTTTQLLMSAAGGLNLPTPPGATSPKDLSNMSPTAVASLAGARVPGIPDGLSMAAHHGYGIHPQFGNMPPSMIDPRLLLPALSGSYEMKENADALLAWRQLAHAQAAQVANAGVLSYDAHAAAMAAASFSYPSYPSMDLNGARRKNATRETTSTLKSWLFEHRKNPYPTKGEKIMLAIVTKMTLTQVSTWFANARRRLKKENKMTWSPRNRTDDGSSVDDEDKPDNEDVVGDDDDVSIDLSDFETENSSPQKQPIPPAVQPITSLPAATIAGLPATASQSAAPPTAPAQSSSSSSDDKDFSGSRPRIWSIADVAANKPSSSTTTTSHTGAIHHQSSSSSARHRPYSIPNSTAFRPWFDSSYRHLAGHPALCNPLLGGRPPITPLRVPHLSTPSSALPTMRSPTGSLTASSPNSSDRAISVENGSPTRTQNRLSPLSQSTSIKREPMKREPEH